MSGTAKVHWSPACVGKSPPGIRWRVLTDGEWFFIECKHEAAEQWEGGLAGTKEWLGLSDEEARRAYPLKKRKE